MLKSCAMAGKEVEITVPSRFSMNRAVAMMSGVKRERGMDYALVAPDRPRRNGQSAKSVAPASGARNGERRLGFLRRDLARRSEARALKLCAAEGRIGTADPGGRHAQSARASRSSPRLCRR